MAKAPAQQPILNIPGIDDASVVELHVKNRGDALVFRMIMDGKEVLIDPDSEWASRDWYGLVIRELDRRNWRYKVNVGTEVDTYVWRKP